MAVELQLYMQMCKANCEYTCYNYVRMYHVYTECMFLGDLVLPTYTYVMCVMSFTVW